jgi:hypothetical protein
MYAGYGGCSFSHSTNTCSPTRYGFLQPETSSNANSAAIESGRVVMAA